MLCWDSLVVPKLMIEGGQSGKKVHNFMILTVLIFKSPIIVYRSDAFFVVVLVGDYNAKFKELF